MHPAVLLPRLDLLHACFVPLSEEWDPSVHVYQVKQLMVQLLQGVDHMHQKWYIHRDLKTSNLLYSNKGFLAVCDFGLARKYGR